MLPCEIHFTLHAGLMTNIARQITSNLEIRPNVRKYVQNSENLDSGSIRR